MTFNRKYHKASSPPFVLRHNPHDIFSVQDNNHQIWTPFRKVKRIIIAVTGGTVLGVGVALIVLPGPAFIVIPAGLAILALEFAWAKRWLEKIKKLIPKRNSGHTKP